MIVLCYMNRFGHLNMTPASKRWISLIRHRLKLDPSVYIQYDMDIEAEMASMNDEKVSDLREGYTVRLRIDDYDYLSRIGYDVDFDEFGIIRDRVRNKQKKP